MIRTTSLQSRTIDLMRLVLIFCVVMVHAYTATRGDIASGQYPVYRFVSFLISLNIGQAAIPGFFFISGFLYFRSTRTYGQRLRHGWHRLVVPYLFWNALMVAVYWSIEAVPALRGFLSGDNLPVHAYGAEDFLRAFWDCGNWDGGNGTPLLHQFWYIRNLLLLGLLSPLVRLFIHRTGAVGLAGLALWWVFAPGQAMIAKSVAFFCFGAWFSLHGQDFLPVFRRWSHPATIAFFMLVALTACFWSHPWSVWLNRLACIAGIVFLADAAARILERRQSGQSLSKVRGLVFFIYAAHDPLIIFLKRLLLRFVPTTDSALTAVYFLAPLFTLTLCTVAYGLLRHTAPHLLNRIVGERIPTKPSAR